MSSVAESRFSNDLRRRSGGHESQRHVTPGYVLEPVRIALGGGIHLDPCTEPDNPTGARVFYTVADDGLSKDWNAPTIFVNPPYGEARNPWVRKSAEAGHCGARVVLLIPAHTDTRIFQFALNSATVVLFIKGRVKFEARRSNGRREAASHPSALIGWNVDLSICEHLGYRVNLRTEIIES